MLAFLVLFIDELELGVERLGLLVVLEGVNHIGLDDHLLRFLKDSYESESTLSMGQAQMKNNLEKKLASL